MHILISNDDGVYAPGLMALYQALQDYAQCQVLAPMSDMSGTSSSLTLDRPLYSHYLKNGFIGLEGTPADCVHMGMHGFLPDKPDLVVSGINLGANLGDDVLYSGTIAAATEGRFAQFAPFAFSLVSRDETNLPTAAYFARFLIENYYTMELPPFTVLNVNIPNLPIEEVKGIRITRLGHRAHPLSPVETINPRGKVGYWISTVGDIVDGDENTDFYAIAEGYVSITPLQVDRSCYKVFDSLRVLEKDFS